MFLFLLCTCIFPTSKRLTDALLDSNTYRSNPNSSIPSPLADQQLYHLATAILDIIHNLDCSAVSFTSQNECIELQNRDSSQMSFYLARTVERRKYFSVLPDEGLRRSKAHDAVIAVDPFPTANFGHLVVIFSLDLDVSFEDCRSRGEWYIGK